MELFGLKPAAQQNNSGKNSKVSKENLPQVIDGDILFVDITEDKLESLKKDPMWNAIPAVKRGSVVYLTDQASKRALGEATPQSLEWLLPRITPKLEEAAKNLSN